MEQSRMFGGVRHSRDLGQAGHASRLCFLAPSDALVQLRPVTAARLLAQCLLDLLDLLGD